MLATGRMADLEDDSEEKIYEEEPTDHSKEAEGDEEVRLHDLHQLVHGLGPRLQWRRIR